MKKVPARFMRMTFFLSLGISVPSIGQTADEEKQVLSLVQSFFDALEKQDTAAFRRMFLKDAYNYSVRETRDTVMVRSQLSTGFRFDVRRTIKERMRPASTRVQIHKRIAMVWAPYDLWVDDKFSHCGVDVFTLIKSGTGWKIASIAYTLETEGCD